MKFNILIKYTPFLSTLLLIIILTISNQKEYTKLRILIWNTPSLALGTYISISTTTGFLLSYLITSNLAKTNKSVQKHTLKFKDLSKNKEIDELIDSPINLQYDNTLIERDIKDPLPTINANFRIIGRKENSNINYMSDNNPKYDKSIELENQYYEEAEKKENPLQVKLNNLDWNDQSFLRW